MLAIICHPKDRHKLLVFDEWAKKDTANEIDDRCTVQDEESQFKGRCRAIYMD